jgi:hypothetical protein
MVHFSLVLGCLLLGTACKQEPAPKALDFATEVRPILESRCINCHHSGALFGDLNLENREAAFRQRPSGPVIVPNAAESSRLYLVLTLPEGDRKAMPPTGHRIPANEMEIIKRWISEGAAWPEGRDGSIKPSAAINPP